MIDSHAHLSSPAVRTEIEAILARAKGAGLSYIIDICTDPEELEHGIILAQNYSWIKLAGATTPHDVDKEGESAFPAFERAALAGQLVAIGESGLDYFYEHSDRVKQKEFLRRYIDLAKRADLPLVIHCREAFNDLFSIFDEEFGKQWGRGVLHCFTGTLAEARLLVEKGWMISLSGIVTFKKSEALQAIAKELPLEHILVETDTPYLAPQSQRGKQNEPAFVLETARYIADLKGIDFAAFVAATEENTKKLFKLVRV